MGKHINELRIENEELRIGFESRKKSKLEPETKIKIRNFSLTTYHLSLLNYAEGITIFKRIRRQQQQTLV